MTPEQHLAILGPEFVAEMQRRAAAAPPPTPDVIAVIRPVLAAATARNRSRTAETAAQPEAA